MPGNSSSGNMRPQSTAIKSSPDSISIMLRPISPRPPSGISRTTGSTELLSRRLRRRANRTIHSQIHGNFAECEAGGIGPVNYAECLSFSGGDRWSSPPARFDQERRIQTVILLEQLQRLLDVVWLFGEPLRIPLFAGHREEVTPVHVNRTGQPANRIGDGMDDVVTERKGLAFAQRLGAGRLDSAIRVGWQPPPENVVFSPR